MTEPENFKQKFDDMMGAYREQLRDPAVTAMLKSIAGAEAALKQAGKHATDEQMNNLLFLLHQESEKAKLVGNMVVITGKLRATDLIDDDEDEDDSDDEKERKQQVLSNLADELGGLGELRHDARGSYFEVAHALTVCGEFDLNNVYTHPEDPDSDETERKVIVYFVPSIESDPTIGWVYAYPDELEVFLPEEPSGLKINQEITEHYPKIASQLDTLPDDCRDPETIMLALQNMELEIDWNDYPHHPEEERKELIEFIEQYITNRVRFDTTLYILSIHDYMMAMGVNGERGPVPLAESIIRSGLIGHVRLLPLYATNDSDPETSNITRYRMSIEFSSPSSEYRGGNNLFQIPLSSIDGIGSTRNPELPVPRPLAELSNPFDDISLVPIEDTEETESLETEDEESDEVEVISPELVNERPSIAEREQELIMIEQHLNEIYGSISAITNTLYDTKEKANQACEEAARLTYAFTILYKESGFPLLEASGTGVLSLRPKLDAEASRQASTEKGVVVLHFTDAVIKESDIVTERRGFFTSEIVISADEDDTQEGKYGVETILTFADTEAMPPIIFGGPELPIIFFQYLPSAQFSVRVGSDAVLTVPELERLRSCRETITEIGKEFLDLESLPWQLTKLHELVDGADPRSFENLSDMGLIHAISESVSGNEKATQYTVDALKYILSSHRVEATGEMYDNEGAPVESRKVRGIVANVASTHLNIPIEELMLAIVDDEQSTWFVPISSLVELKY